MSDYPPTVPQNPVPPPPPSGGYGAPPPGPPPGPPGGYGPPAGQPAGSGFTRNHAIVIGVVLVVLLAAIGGVLLLRSDDAAADEVFLEPVGSTGDDPFTNSVTVNTDTDVQTAIDNDATAVAGGSEGVQTFSGGDPGLYGGTQSNGHCDRAQLVAFLEDNPTKARAWATVLGITTSEIPAFVDDLTPVLLRADTRVTNHGFVDGTANQIPAVLQAGTAVLVDRFGRPVVKCACGNPLAPPTPASSPRYTGPGWDRFTPTTITVIQQTTIEIDVFVLTDPVTGDTFRRPAGTAGDADTADEDEPPPTTTPPATAPPVTQPPATQPPATQAPIPGGAEEALSIFNDADASCGAADYPFDDAETIDSSDAIPTSDPDVYDVQLQRTTAAGESQFFSFLVNVRTGDITPNSELARQAAAVCPAFS